MVVKNKPGSARRPGKGPAPQEMDMEVKDLLPRPCPIIDDEAVIAQSLFFGDLIGHPIQMAYKFLVCAFHGRHLGDFFLWNNQYMSGGLRFDVMKGQTMFILIDNFCRDFLVDDFFKNSAHLDLL